MTKHPTVETFLHAGLSFAAIAATLLVMPAPSAAMQTFALALGVALIGLPHGALDPLLARRAGLMSDWRAVILFHAAYLATVGLVLAFWFTAPVLALVIFLIYSAHHFAGDWLDKPFAQRLAIGASVLSLPAMFHVSAVSDIYVLLSGEAARQIAQAQLWLAPLWLLIISGSIIGFVWQKQPWDALEIAILLIGALFLPPLIFFLIYFCALHSPRHFLAIWRASANRRQAARIAGFYTVASLLMVLAAILAFGPANEMIASMQKAVFIGLAALTVPHMVLAIILEGRPRD